MPVVTAIMEGRRPTIYGDGLQTRDFTYVANNVQANILAATTQKPVAGKTINIACGKSFSLLDLLKAINEALYSSSAVVPLWRGQGEEKMSLRDGAQPSWQSKHRTANGLTMKLSNPSNPSKASKPSSVTNPSNPSLVTLADNETQASETQCTEDCRTNYTPGQSKRSAARSVSGSETQITQVQRSEICKAELSNSQRLLGTIPEAQRSGKSSVPIEPLFAPARKGDVKHSLADISLARELLGYEVEVDFNDGIRRTVEWYLKLNRMHKNDYYKSVK